VPEVDLDRRTDETYTRLWWDGDVIVADATALHDDPEAIERIEPDQQGRYVVMCWSWCWEAVDPYDCARIVGEVPGPDASREWVLLTHAPYTRVAPAPYSITALVSRGEGRGYAAELHHAGEPVAFVDGFAAAAGTQTPARLAPMTGRFDPEAWRAYVGAARRCGEPMTGAAVLDALAEEALLDREVAEAVAAGGTLVRLLDDTGTNLHLERADPAPATPEAFRALQDRLRATRRDPRGVAWQ
jgi:hypothetical protein